MQPIVLPKKLRLGSLVTLIAPSEPVRKLEYDKARKFLVRKGLKVTHEKNLFERFGEFSAGSPEERASDFMASFTNKKTSAVFMARGGYSADQILDLIDFKQIKKNPKIFLGFSDATILQLALFAKCGLVSFHGPNALGLVNAPLYSISNMFKVLFGKSTNKISPLSNWKVLRPGNASGILIGGNLECIASIIGTKYDPFPQLRGKKIILFWEDYKTEYTTMLRKLYQLKNAGIFEMTSGMLVGKLKRCHETDYKIISNMNEQVLEITKPFGFPVMTNMDFGHEVAKLTLPIGVKARFSTSNKSFGFEKSVK